MKTKGFMAWTLVASAPLAIGALLFAAQAETGPRPLDVGATLAAARSSADDVIIHEAPARANADPLAGTWVDTSRDLITERETVEGSYQHMGAITPQVNLDYSERFNIIYENLTTSDEEFAPETYNRQLEETLNSGKRPVSTGRTETVRGKRAEEYKDTLPAKGGRPEAEAKLYVDPKTDLVLREEYELADPRSGRSVILVRERVPRAQAPKDALTTPEQLKEIAARARQERIAKVARLPYEVPWVGESFGNLKLAKLEADDFWVRLDYVADDGPQGPEVLSVVVQDANGRSTEEASPDPERSRPTRTPEGKKVAYEAGPIGPDGRETGFVAFEQSRTKVLVQKSGEVRGEDGGSLSLLQVVDELKPVR